MSDTVSALAELVDAASRALSGPQHRIRDAPGHVPNTPGLYAVHAAPTVWPLLGLSARDDVPLYIGKSETSLAVRELKTHFSIDRGRSSKTAGSTVRRSFAALLGRSLDLRGRPRGFSDLTKVLKPIDFTNYALDYEAEERLTDWMHEHLAIAVWVKPPNVVIPLVAVERLLLRMWEPPINIQDVPNPSMQLRMARKEMADEAREWAQNRS